MRLPSTVFVAIAPLLIGCNTDEPEQCFGPRPTEPLESNSESFCRTHPLDYAWPEEKDGAIAIEYTACEEPVLGEGQCRYEPCDIDTIRNVFLDQLATSDGETSECLSATLADRREVDFVPVCLEDLVGFEHLCCYSAVIYADCPPFPDAIP